MRSVGVEFALLPEAFIKSIEHIVEGADQWKNLCGYACGRQAQSRMPWIDFRCQSCQLVEWSKRSPHRKCADSENCEKERNSEPASVHGKLIEDGSIERLCHWHGLFDLGKEFLLTNVRSNGRAQHVGIFGIDPVFINVTVLQLNKVLQRSDTPAGCSHDSSGFIAHDVPISASWIVVGFRQIRRQVEINRPVAAR